MTSIEPIVRYCMAREDFTFMATPEVLAALQAEFPRAGISDFVFALREAARRQFAQADEIEDAAGAANDA